MTGQFPRPRGSEARADNFPDIQVEVTPDEDDECFRLILGDDTYMLHATQIVELQYKVGQALLDWQASAAGLALQLIARGNMPLGELVVPFCQRNPELGHPMANGRCLTCGKTTEELA